MREGDGHHYQALCSVKHVFNEFLLNYERFCLDTEIEYASGVIVLVIK